MITAHQLALAIIVTLAAIFLVFGCDTTKAPNQVAYRENKTGAINGVDISTCVTHYADDPKWLWHDCNGDRDWQEVVVNDNGILVRHFQEITTSP